jgi:hypothetical protein
LVVSIQSQDRRNGEIVDMEEAANLKKLAGQPIALRLPSACLQGAPRGLDETRAAAAYMMIAAAVLPADGPLSHLERAARLSQVTPVRRASGKVAALYRLIDLQAAANPEPRLKIAFIDRTFPWPTRVVDLNPDEAISVLVPGAPPCNGSA